MKNLSRVTLLFSLLATIFLQYSSMSQAGTPPGPYRSAVRRGTGSQIPPSSRAYQKNAAVSPVAKIQSEPLLPLRPVTGRAVVTDYAVTTTNDSGSGSLRQALSDANAHPGFDRVVFSISGAGVHTIMLVKPLPDITDSVIIDGATQPGYSGVPRIELNGSAAAAGSNGLVIKGGNSVVRGLVINRFVANGDQGGMGIILDARGNNIIEGNYIGTSAAGDSAKGNGGSGIGIFGGSSDNLIGGTTAAARNVISGNGGSGIQISTGSAGNNRIKGNAIGISAATWDSVGNKGNGIIIDAIGDSVGGDYGVATNIIADNDMPGIALLSNAMNTVIQGNSIGWLSGDVAWGNHDNGIVILGGQDILIGGTADEKRNLIAASANPGIAIVGNTASGNIIQGNWIGGCLKIRPTSWTLVDGNSMGIVIENAPGNVIGGTAAGAGNVISENIGDGVVIRGGHASGNRVEGNTVGASGTGVIVDAGNGGNGVKLEDAPANSIGGNDPMAANYISGNRKNGILITGTGAVANAVKGNVIGISQTDGQAYWGNMLDGILIAASGDTIGGNGPNDGNSIAYNRGAGVFDSTGNHNPILRNSIYLNNGLGIDLSPRGFTKNDLLDADLGANDGQNFPILDSAIIDYPTSIQIFGRMNSSPNGAYRLDFYKNDTCNSSKFGDGQTWFGSGMVYCDASGYAKIDLLIPTAVASTEFITATATDAQGSTSAFSRALRMLDSDGDGILDMWEERNGGIDWDSDGQIDLDLWSKNANPYHKDLFVEVDRMAGFLTSPDALADVAMAFHQVPNRFVNNPDGNDGINLHAEFDDSETPVPVEVLPANPWGRVFAIKAENYGTTAERTSPNKANILGAKDLVYRYCLFGDQYGTTGSSGQAQAIYSRDFIVTLGNPGFNDTILGVPVPGGKESQQAGTFMHELGHTLGLRHGGADDNLYKTNYYSVMNYLWQFPRDYQRPGSWELGYSPSALPTLNETHLDELHGLDPLPGDYGIVTIPYNRPDNSYGYADLAPATAVDWDGDNDSTGFAKKTVDINYFEGGSGPGVIHPGYADWPNLRYSVRNLPHASSPRMAKEMADTAIDEMTPDRNLKMQSIAPYGIIKPLSHWSKDTTKCTSVSTGHFSDYEESAIGNADGGATIVWMHAWDEFSGSDSSWDIRSQRIDSLGRIMWDNNGISISKGVKAPQLPSIVTDGSNGTIITWDDVRLGGGKHGVYSQRFDRNGWEQWAPGGVMVTSLTSSGDVLYPMSFSDNRGGAIITWTLNRTVHAQRIGPDGTGLWGTDGLQLMDVGTPFEYRVVSDRSGGAIIFWENRLLGGPYSFPWFAQHIDSAGTPLWGAGGIQVSPSTTDEASFFGTPAGGAIALFSYSPTTDYQRLGLQRIGPDGSLRWPLTGIQVDTTVRWSGRWSPNVVQDESGALTISWLMRYNGQAMQSLFVQRIDSSGAIQWRPGGIPVNSSLTRDEYALVGAKNHNIAILYQASRNEYRAQYIDSAGILPWSAEGMPVNHGPEDNDGLTAFPGNHNGTIVIFATTGLEYKYSSQFRYRHIYAQRLNDAGGLGDAIVTSVRDGHPALPDNFGLDQNYPNPFNPRTTIGYKLPVASRVTLRIYNLLGQMVKELVNMTEPAGSKSVTWDVTNLASGVYFYRMEATSVAIPGKTFTSVKKMLLLR